MVGLHIVYFFYVLVKCFCFKTEQISSAIDSYIVAFFLFQHPQLYGYRRQFKNRLRDIKHCNIETSFSVWMKQKTTLILLFLKYACLKLCAHVNGGVWLNIYQRINDMNDDTCNNTLADYHFKNNQSNKTTK